MFGGVKKNRVGADTTSSKIAKNTPTAATIDTVPAPRSRKVRVLVGGAAQCAVLGAQLRGARLCAPLHRRQLVTAAPPRARLGLRAGQGHGGLRHGVGRRWHGDAPRRRAAR